MNELRSERTNGDGVTLPLPACPLAPPIAPAWRASKFVEILQTILTALMLAFIFRSFMVEAFVIPTGSMAHSLLGMHATRTCPACGWEYDFSPANQCLCPNCHLREPLSDEQAAPKAGDRILVHKWPHALGGVFRPRRWAVIVFRNPSQPDENYIKRLVGLPGDTVEIIDGDVFINGRISRKTPAAQSVLWFLVFDQSYYPRPDSGPARAPRWVPEPDTDDADAGWSGMQTRVIRYHGPDDQVRGLRFRPADDLQYFQDVYAYNRGASNAGIPYVGDLRVVAEVTFGDADGFCRWELKRDGYRFVAETRRDGRVSLTMTTEGAGGEPTLVGADSLPRFRSNHPYVIEFGHLDYRVYLKVDGREALRTTEADYGPDTVALRELRRTAPVGLRIAAAAIDLELRGLRVDRDVYYTYRAGTTRRAYAGRPFVLERNEYFVLGDNSPDSRDGREWTERGPHLPDDYRIGTVRSDQIVGPAAFVYLPGLSPWWLPDLGRVRFVR